MDLMTVAAICGLVGTISGILCAWVGYSRGAKKDCRQDGETDGVLKSDVDYIKRGVDDIRLEQRAMRQDMSTLAERVTRVEESCKQAHKRIDRQQGNG